MQRFTILQWDPLPFCQTLLTFTRNYKLHVMHEGCDLSLSPLTPQIWHQLSRSSWPWRPGFNTTMLFKEPMRILEGFSGQLLRQILTRSLSITGLILFRQINLLIFFSHFSHYILILYMCTRNIIQFVESYVLVSLYVSLNLSRFDCDANLLPRPTLTPQCSHSSEVIRCISARSNPFSINTFSATLKSASFISNQFICHWI